jgi:hypothetical protein
MRARLDEKEFQAIVFEVDNEKMTIKKKRRSNGIAGGAPANPKARG